MEFTNEVYDAVNRYFSILKRTGYKSYKEVEKLLIMIFFEELLDGPMSQFITEKDYNSIINSQYCLYGTCMIPYPDYKRTVDGMNQKILDPYRVTETGSFRTSEHNTVRIMS